MFSLKLSESGRILSATFPQYDPEGIIVDSLPDGDISDYKYINGQYIYDPLPKKEEEESLSPKEEIVLLKQRISALEKETINQK